MTTGAVTDHEVNNWDDPEALDGDCLFSCECAIVEGLMRLESKMS